MQREECLEQSSDYPFVRSDRQMHKSFLKDGVAIEGLENYVCIYTESSKLPVRSTMKRVMEVLPKGLFLQVHKSHVANLEKIDNIDGNRIIVGQHTIPIACNFRAEVFARILKYCIIFSSFGSSLKVNYFQNLRIV